MPDVGNVSVQLLIPPNPLHFLTILRYVSMALLLFVVISPREGGGTLFLILMAATAILIAADVYGTAVIEAPIVLMLIRVGIVAIPIVLAGTGTEATSRQVMGLIALLGVPAIFTMFFLCSVDPAVTCA